MTESLQTPAERRYLRPSVSANMLGGARLGDNELTTIRSYGL
jgi:hypothetical protein